MDNTVYIVHSVDTEGPLYESLQERFERVHAILDVEEVLNLEQTEENFRNVISGKVDFGPKQELIQKAFSLHRVNFMDSWPKLDAMLERVTSSEFRHKMKDSFGNGYIYNWFILDQVSCLTNPRRRALGYHVVFDHYLEFMNRAGNQQDGLHWHFHPASTYSDAHYCGTSLLNSPHIWESLARRVIDKEWFPTSVRCGFQTERPDIHWFLEQYIPFDFTNTALEDASELDEQADLAHGRFGDWRLAPKDWRTYHPSHDSYQLEGDCRRIIARSLNVLSRFGNLDQFETEKAFARAAEGKPTILGVANHDFRDMEPEVEEVRQLIAKVAPKFPNVNFKFAEARDAMREVEFNGQMDDQLELDVQLVRSANGLPQTLVIKTVSGKVFGPQPFLAIRTRGKRYIHDNLDFGCDLKSWRYQFDEETVMPDDVAAVGVAACDRYGNQSIKVFNL